MTKLALLQIDQFITNLASHERSRSHIYKKNFFYTGNRNGKFWDLLWI